jgi:hypothetical protein
MIIAAMYSFNNGRQIVNEKYPTLMQEIRCACLKGPFSSRCMWYIVLSMRKVLARD